MTPGEEMAQCAKQQIGDRYAWATAGPETFDCSGLVAYCYRRVTGQEITRSSYGQGKLGVSIPRSQAQPGDLLFYDTAGDGYSHVGIVTGPNSAVHALNESLGVRETKIDGANLGGPLIDVRRILPGGITPPKPIPKPPKKKPDRPRKRPRL